MKSNPGMELELYSVVLIKVLPYLPDIKFGNHEITYLAEKLVIKVVFHGVTNSIKNFILVFKT